MLTFFRKWEPLKRTLFGLCCLVVLMFGFVFALVPLYSVFCKATGLNGKVALTPGLDPISENSSDNNDNNVSDYNTYNKVGRYRVSNETKGHHVTIEFDVTVYPNMPFEFKPEHSALQIALGELTHTAYHVKNKTNRTLVIQAIPSISPGIVAKYLRKLECFCFNKQTLKPNEQMVLPLRFWLEPEFPDSVHRLTLSYTIFDITDKEGSSI